MIDEGFDDFEENADSLNDTLAQTSQLVTGFDGELRRMKTSLEATSRDIAVLERGLSKGLLNVIEN